MKEEILDSIQGRPMCIQEMRIESVGQILLQMNCRVESRPFKITFSNVSNLCLSEVNYPIWIEGFEIMDNEKNGWEAYSRYTIRDYENGNIFFYCEDIDILAGEW